MQFRFVYDYDWRSPVPYAEEDVTADIQVMSTFANYSEPFNCECRAYGRLQDAGREDLAVKSYGYILLSEHQERNMMEKFSHLDLEFDGNMDDPGSEDMRGRFRIDGRDPPIRGLLKEFGQGDEDLTTPVARRLLKNIKELQSLGIFNVDVARRQVISGKFSDFSTAVTVPHFVTSPELNPNLDSDQKLILEFETFQLSSNDYWLFDEMVKTWNDDNNGNIKVHAFPGGDGCLPKHNYNLRRKRIYTFVDPRKLEGVKKKRKLTEWEYNCDDKAIARLKCTHEFSESHEWVFKDGYIFPRINVWRY